MEYIDQASGMTGDRDAFKRLFTDASRRLFDVVVVWALDRFTREGVLETFEYIRDLTRYGVQFESYTEAHFRTTGMAGELMLAITAWITKQERLRITERVNAGIARARLHGTKSGAAIGRPRAVFNRAKILELRNEGKSWRSIAATLGVGIATVHRAFQTGVPKPIADERTRSDAKPKSCWRLILPFRYRMFLEDVARTGDATRHAPPDSCCACITPQSY